MLEYNTKRTDLYFEQLNKVDSEESTDSDDSDNNKKTKKKDIKPINIDKEMFLIISKLLKTINYKSTNYTKNDKKFYCIKNI